MIEQCQQIVLAFFGESWPSSVEPRRIHNPPSFYPSFKVHGINSLHDREINVARVCLIFRG